MNFITDLIIRPNRNTYSIRELGDKIFTYANMQFKRIDFNRHIKNKRNEYLSSSLWCPLQMDSKSLSLSPCIVYCHGNGGNKIDIIEIFQYLLYDFNIFSFDFSGAGNSEGKYVTLGYFEKNDVESVVHFLNKELNISKIILYGRSMGAVSALRCRAPVIGLVLDSPFCDFEKLCDDVLGNKFFLPGIVRRMLIKSGRERIIEKANFDICDFKPFMDARNITVPTILIHGKQDAFVPIEHGRTIYKNISTKICKKMLEVEGGHNDERGNDVIEVVREFILNFAYDPMVLKEYKRRMKLKQSHLLYVGKNKINVEETIKIRRKQKINNFNFKDKTRNNSNSKDKIKFQKIKRKKRAKTPKLQSTKQKFEQLYNYDVFILDEVDNDLAKCYQTEKPKPRKINKQEVGNKIINVNNISSISTSENKLNKSQIEIDQLANIGTSCKKFNDSNYTKNKIRSNRLNHLGQIFDCEVRVRSSEIIFKNVDKQSLRMKK